MQLFSPEADSRECDLQAVARYRDREFAKWLSVALSLACETHPELIRDALGGAFDPEAVIKATNAAAGQLANLWTEHESLRAKIGYLQGEIDRLVFTIEKMETAVAQARKEFRKCR